MSHINIPINGGAGAISSVTTSNATPQFVQTGTVENVNFGLTNLLLGQNGSTITSGTLNVGVGLGALASVTSGAGNVAIGNSALTALTQAENNVAIGYLAGSQITDTGSANVLIGSGAGQNMTIGVNTFIGDDAGRATTTGTSNTVVGQGAYNNALTGVYNIALGYSAASDYEGAESGNIIIGNPGVSAESNTIRIGIQGNGNNMQNACFIAGIVGVTSSHAEMVTINSTTGQMGVAAIPSGGIVTINGDTGSITGTTVSIKSASTAGSSTGFTGSASAMTFSVTDANDNVIIGGSAGNNSITGTANTGLGFASLNALTSGTDNMGIGYASLDGVKTGSYNVAIGANAGTSYTGAESSNILFNSIGTAAESNVFRVGSGTGTSAQQINKTIINGIQGITVTSPAYVAINTSTGQLGQASANQTQSTRSCVTAVVSSTTTNNTGDGTTYTIVWNQVTSPGFDQNSNFNTGTGTFTAPVTGKYLVCVNVTLGGTQAAATDGLLQIIVAGTSGQTYNLSRNVPRNNNGSTYTANAIVTMTATDTLTTTITISGLSKVIGIQGGTNYPSLLSITLIC